MRKTLNDFRSHLSEFALRTRSAQGPGAMTLGALGVAFGDIGTSPLYALNEIFFSRQGLEVNQASVLGCASLVFWALTLIVLIKYILFVLRADYDSEGGVFALYGLLYNYKKQGRRLFLWMLILAAGFLLSEGVITPAISVLSAVEGLKIVAPQIESYIVPIAIVILSTLFFIQKQGTAKVGRYFGPIILLWFLVIAIFGFRQVVRAPDVFRALNPVLGFSFLLNSSFKTVLLVLGGVILAVTGCESLYADMGHFGRRAISRGWFFVVYPALILNYFGQAAFLLSGQQVQMRSLFFSLVPHAFIFPMVILASAAAAIASQALISGAYSLLSQATALGLFPRHRIIHTHHRHHGQIYSPMVNWLLFLGTILLVLVFSSSSRLAALYGLGLSAVMLSTSISMHEVARLIWRWPWYLTCALFGSLALIDLVFVGASSVKFLHGGVVPIAIGLGVFLVMAVWRWGRKATFAAYAAMSTRSLGEVLQSKEGASSFLEKNVLLMVPKPLVSREEPAPALLLMFLQRYGHWPRHLIFLEVVHQKTPFVHERRYDIRSFQKSETHGTVTSVSVNFGFMEEPNVEIILEQLAAHKELRLDQDQRKWLVHVAQENILLAKDSSIFVRARLRMFLVLRQLSRPGHYFYGLGNQVQLSIEVFPVKLNSD